MSETKHTIEQLQAMPDSELAELTVRLRGWTTDGLFLRDSGDPLMHKLHWNPAADIAQAYGLLVWAKQQGRAFRIILSDEDAILYRRGKYQWDVVSVLGNDARAMVYAFVLAMEAING